MNREIIEKYAGAIYEQIEDIVHKLAESLGVQSDFMKGWTCQFRINKYNFTPETVGSSGVQIHTDSGFLTILQDDENVGGLEVMNKSGVFVPVDPWPGTLLVNLGDVAKVGNWENINYIVRVGKLLKILFLTCILILLVFTSRPGAMGGCAQ